MDLKSIMFIDPSILMDDNFCDRSCNSSGDETKGE